MIRTPVLVAVFGALALAFAPSAVADARPIDPSATDAPVADGTTTGPSPAVAAPSGRGAERGSSSVGVASPLGKTLAIVLAMTGLVRLGILKQEQAERRRLRRLEEERSDGRRRRPSDLAPT